MGSSPGSFGLKGTKPSSSKIGGESGGRFGGSGSGVGSGAGSGIGAIGAGAGSGVGVTGAGSGVGAGVGATGVGSGTAGVGGGVGVAGAGRVGKVRDSRGLVAAGFAVVPPAAVVGAAVLVEGPKASETGGCVLLSFFEPQFFGRIESSVLHELSAMASKVAVAEVRRMDVFMCVVWCVQPFGMGFD